METNDVRAHRLEGRRVLVTGAASGIGKATAIRLAAEGATVACIDRDVERLEKVVSAIQSASSQAGSGGGAGSGGSAHSVVCDLEDRRAIPEAVDAAVATLGGLDAVCTIAGVGGFWMDEDFPLEEWDRLIAINLTATWLICQRSLPHLLATGHGAIVTTASTAATDATPYETAYAATKGAIIAITRSLSINHAKAGLRVNCIAPGPIMTPISKQYVPPPNADPSLLRVITPFGEIGQPEEVAAVYAFLVSDDASHVSGQILRVDGGKRA